MNYIRYHPNALLLFLLILVGSAFLHRFVYVLKPIYDDKSESSSSSSLHKSSRVFSFKKAHDSSYEEVDNTPSLPSCRRVCDNQYQNVILLTRLGQAGWTDRMNILSSILQLSGYLCAQVWIPRPKYVLTPRHNHDQELSINVSWSDLSDFQFVHQPKINRSSLNGRFISSPSASSFTNPLVEWIDPLDINQLPNVQDVIDDSNYTGWFYLHTDQIAKITSDFEVVEQLSWNNNEANNSELPVGFIWEIRADYFKWKYILSKYLLDRRLPKANVPDWLTTYVTKNQTNVSQQYNLTTDEDILHNLSEYHNRWQMMQPYVIAKFQFDANMSEGCEYTTLSPPSHVQKLIDKIYKHTINLGSQAISNASTIFTNVTEPKFGSKKLLNNTVSFVMGYFHIRRNDATKDCNTSLESIGQYLNCSFDTLGVSFGSKGIYKKKSLIIAVFFSSDETDPQYRQAVIQMVEQQTYRLRGTTGALPLVTVICIDADNLVNQLLDEEIQQGNVPEWRRNNFYLYETVYFLSQNRSMIQFKLEKRRFFRCPNCINIADQIHEI